jgi:outer membrane protein TolC
MKQILSVILILFLSVRGLVNAGEAPAHHTVEVTNFVRLDAAVVNQFIARMRTNHPALRAANARLVAASTATNAVRTWENPEFAFGGSVSSPRGFNPAEEGDLVYGLEQKLPLFGKAAAARRVAQAEAASEETRAALVFQVRRRDLAKALFRAAYTEQTLEISRQDLAWLGTMAVTMEERYRSGSATQVDVLRVQNDRSKRVEQLRTDERRRDNDQVSINRLLGAELQTPLPKFDLPEPAASIANSPQLVDLAVRHEPTLRVMRRQIEMAEANVAVTRKSRLPEVSGFIDGRQYSGDGGFREGTFGVKLSLPWFNAGKYRSDLARDRARVEAAELDATDYQLGVREEVHRLTANIDAARREALLYRDQILPRTRQAMESAHANWLAGRGMSFDVMEARRMLLDAQVQYARAVSEQYQMMSELVLCCGLGDFEALEAFADEPAKTVTP